jgi:hypothetical protein
MPFAPPQVITGGERDMTGKDLVRVAAVGDLHFARTSPGSLQSLFDKRQKRPTCWRSAAT